MESCAAVKNLMESFREIKLLLQHRFVILGKEMGWKWVELKMWESP